MTLLSPHFVETTEPLPVPELLVELPSRSGVFFSNLRDFILPRRLPPLELKSRPGRFWPDVFVRRGLPWFSFLESSAYHVIALGFVVVLSRLFALHSSVVARPAFDHTQVIYYSPSEYLPPLDTRTDPSTQPTKANLEYSPQPIISVPAEADNHSQTIVAPPNVKLKQDARLPNIVAWADKMQRPQLEIPSVPLTPAAENSRMTPRMENSVVTPPPEASRLSRRRDQVKWQASVVAPPPDLQARSKMSFAAPEPSVVAPPPALQDSSSRRLGDMNIAPSQVIAPAPQLPVAEQRVLAGGRSRGLSAAPQVVPPPPSTGIAGSAGQSFGSPGRVIALSLHPDVAAPPVPPAGNRRGTFAAGPEGHAGASGSPGESTGSAAGTGTASGNSKGNGAGSTKGRSGDLPSGLYVGTPPASSKTSSVAGDPAGAKSPPHPTTIASATVPASRVGSSPSHPAEPGNTAKLTEAERNVFGGRKFYSLTLNMPNLNSAGGSWVIRFAELKQDLRAPASDLSQPIVTRKVDPGYPIQLMKENVAGTVILYAVIRADGTVGDVRILNGVDDRIDRLAISAVAQWKFEPATKNGSPINVEATFKIPFVPPKSAF